MEHSTILSHQTANKSPIWPVENLEKLNELRKEIEAGSIEEYVQLLKTATGCEVIYDPELTVSQIKKEAYQMMNIYANMNRKRIYTLWGTLSRYDPV